MTKNIENFIQYLHDVKQTSKNTELSYERDLRKMNNFCTNCKFCRTRNRFYDISIDMYQIKGILKSEYD